MPTKFVKFGPLTLNADRDGARIQAMSPERQAKAAALFHRFVELEKDVDALRDEINGELEEGIK